MTHNDLTLGVAQLRRGAVALAIGSLLAPGVAAAQEGDGDAVVADGTADIDEELMESAAEGEGTEEKAGENKDLAEIGEDLLEVFVLDRGFYVSSDLGVFLTLAGARGYSNVQPYMAVQVGFDIGDYFGVQVDLSTGYSSGNPASNADWPVLDPRGLDNPDATVNYGLFNAGLELVGAIRPTQRFAVEIKGGGGFTFIDPPLSKADPTVPRGSRLPKYGGTGGHYVVGVDIKYLTLLSNFTAGATITHYGFLGAFGYIPAIGIGVVVRYTL